MKILSAHRIVEAERWTTPKRQRLNRLSRLDAKVDALLKGAGIHFDPFRDVPADVRTALERGETIVAIKRFRESTGASLKEAKAFVDEVRRRRADGVAQL